MNLPTVEKLQALYEKVRKTYHQKGTLTLSREELVFLLDLLQNAEFNIKFQLYD